jgi:hypothetical protein
VAERPQPRAAVERLAHVPAPVPQAGVARVDGHPQRHGDPVRPRLGDECGLQLRGVPDGVGRVAERRDEVVALALLRRPRALVPDEHLAGEDVDAPKDGRHHVRVLLPEACRGRHIAEHEGHGADRKCHLCVHPLNVAAPARGNLPRPGDMRHNPPRSTAGSPRTMGMRLTGLAGLSTPQPLHSACRPVSAQGADPSRAGHADPAPRTRSVSLRRGCPRTPAGGERCSLVLP